VKKIDSNSFYNKRDTQKILKNLDLLWKNAMRINNPRKRSHEILRIHKMIKRAVSEVRSKDSANVHVRSTSRMLINWILTHEGK